METSAKATLVKLSDTTMMIADEAEDICGRQVLDKAGHEIGEVDALLIDDQESKVRFLQVASGGLLGLGATKFLIPVDAVTRVDEDYVHIDQTRERIASAPGYDPELIDGSYYDDVYGYYGYAPYWAPGYIYPGYPYF